MTRTNLNRMHKAAKALELKAVQMPYSTVYKVDNVVYSKIFLDNKLVDYKQFNLLGALVGLKPKAKHFRAAGAWADKMIKRHFKTPHQASTHSTDQKQTTN